MKGRRVEQKKKKKINGLKRGILHVMTHTHKKKGGERKENGNDGRERTPEGYSLFLGQIGKGSEEKGSEEKRRKGKERKGKGVEQGKKKRRPGRAAEKLEFRGRTGARALVDPEV